MNKGKDLKVAAKKKSSVKPKRAGDKGKTKKGVAVRSAHRAATPPKKPFELKIGKRYQTKSRNVIVKIVDVTGMDGVNEFHGEIISGKLAWAGYGRFWGKQGHFHDPANKSREGWRDLKPIQKRREVKRGK